MGRILLLILILIVYGSLYPFDFQTRGLSLSAAWRLLYSWPTDFDRSIIIDIVLNILIYLPLGFAGGLSIGSARSMLLAATLSAGIELLQIFVPARTCSTLDLTTNIVGAGAGTWLAHVYGKSLVRSPAKSAMRIWLRPSPALLLLGCWVAYQAFPLVPYLRLSPLWRKVYALLYPAPFSTVQMIATTFAWLAAAHLLEEIHLGARALGLMMLLVPARIVIANRSFTWAELTGTALAWVLWNAWPGRHPKRSHVLEWIGIVVLLLRGLAPFHWQDQAAVFSWMPFGGFFETGKEWSPIVFFEKGFLYGTAIWLFIRSGYSATAAGLGVAALLGLVEVLQIHLPGRTPESTDPVYALIMAALLKLLQTHRRDRMQTSE